MSTAIAIYACNDCEQRFTNDDDAAEHSDARRHCVEDLDSPNDSPCNSYCRRADH